jgi:thiol-disulfide isomerase/thioredoxin
LLKRKTGLLHTLYQILNILATWCTSCLHNFPKLDSLQRKYADRLQVLLVNAHDTRDDKAKLTAFFTKRKTKSGDRYILPTLVKDSITSVLFPHKGVPHYVWIDKNGIVRAITESEHVTSENIEAFINGSNLNLPVRKELEYDFTKPLFVNGNGSSNENYTYRSLLAGYLDGLPSSGGTFTDEDGKVIRISDINTSILSLYRLAYDELGPVYNNRIILNVQNPAKYHLKGPWDSWKHEFSVSYELILPPCSKEEAKKAMQEDLKRYFGLSVVKERRITPCLVFRKKEIPEKIISKTSDISESNIYDDDNSPKYLHNRSIAELVRYLNSELAIPAINETGFDKKINIDLPADLSDVKKLSAALKKYGFDLLEESREIEFFVLSESKK